LIEIHRQDRPGRNQPESRRNLVLVAGRLLWRLDSELVYVHRNDYEGAMSFTKLLRNFVTHSQLRPLCSWRNNKLKGIPGMGIKVEARLPWN
jgi:hypothetical protein